MPTAGKLTAALALAALAWLATLLTVPHLPQGRPVGWLAPANALLFALAGWRVLGPRTGGGLAAAAGAGLSAMLVGVLLVLLLWGGYEMLLRATRLRYDGPVEALGGLVLVGLELSRLLLVPQVAAVLVAGAILAGLLTEAVARRWP